MTPTVTKMEVYPVAGKDCMELNLSGAHAPYFTRNIVILTDSTGATGVGEVPGGQKITRALEDVKHLVEGTSIGAYKNTLKAVSDWLSANIKDDVRGQQTFDLRTGVHVVTAIEAPLLDLLGKYLGVLAIVACVIVFIVGVLNGIPVLDIFMTAVSLAVSAIPEGLPAIVTIVLSIGVQRMRRNMRSSVGCLRWRRWAALR